MDEKIKVGGVDAGDPYGLKFFAAVSQMQAELATLRDDNERYRAALLKVTTVYLGAKNRTENFGMIYDVLAKHIKEALK